MFLRLGGSLGAVAILASCQAFVSSNVFQCTTDGDCTSRGGDFAGTRCESRVCRPVSAVPDAGVDAAVDSGPKDPKWGCLGNVSWPSQSPTEKVRYRQRFNRLLAATPIVGVRVKACASLDPECTTPFAQGETTATGDIILDLPKHFRGYLHVPVGPDSFKDMAPTILAVYPPPDKDSNLAVEPAVGTVPILVSLAELNFLLGQVGSATDPNLGHVFGLTTDCAGQPTGGVSLRTSIRDPKTIQYYYEGNGTPSVTAQESDSTGNAGFLNLPAGVISMETQVPSIARKAGSYSVLVKKGSVTVVDLVPTP